MIMYGTNPINFTTLFVKNLLFWVFIQLFLVFVFFFTHMLHHKYKIHIPEFILTITRKLALWAFWIRLVFQISLNMLIVAIE